MWETLKNDPILKVVTIVILSVLGFGLAFNIMFGQNNSGMEHTLSYIFTLAFKMLLITLIVVAFIALYKFVRKHLFEGGEVKVIEQIKKDTVLKGLTITALLIATFGLVYYLFSGILGFGHGYGRMSGYSAMGGIGYGFGLAGLLTALIKILMVVSVAGLIIGIAMYVRQNFGKELAEKLTAVKLVTKLEVKCPNCGTAAANDFKFCPQCGGNLKVQCSACGGELKKEWKCCPVCGNEVVVIPNEATVEAASENTAGTAAETLSEEQIKPDEGTKPQKGKRG